MVTGRKSTGVAGKKLLFCPLRDLLACLSCSLMSSSLLVNFLLIMVRGDSRSPVRFISEFAAILGPVSVPK